MVAEGGNLGHVLMGFEAPGQVAYVVPGAGGVEGAGLGECEVAGRSRLVYLPGLSMGAGQQHEVEYSSAVVSLLHLQ